MKGRQPISKRRRGREMAVQMLYQSDLGGADGQRVVAAYDPSEISADEPGPAAPRATADGRLEAALAYARSLVRGTLEHRDEIDRLIREQAENWRIERMPPVDRNILRLAVYELLYEHDVPKLVVLDEAIELAKKFGSEQSGSFVNGLLDGLLKSHSFPGSLT